MARPGVGMERITQVIKELEAEGQEPTVTAVRERLGSGSFSTIGAVVSEWRREKATGTRPVIPEPPEVVRSAFAHFWSEAWKAALAIHEPERQAFARDRQEYERGKGEMVSEISRLESELDVEKENGVKAVQDVTKERDDFRVELESVRGRLATVEGALSEARTQLEREGERNRELSERVIAEAARAQTLAATLEAVKKQRAEKRDGL